MSNKNSFEETREEIPTAVLPVDRPDVVAISEHIQAANEIAKRNGWPSILVAFSCVENKRRKGTMGVICSTIGPKALLETCKGFGASKGLHIAASMIEAHQAVKRIKSLLDSESSHGGQTIKDAIDALRSDDAANSSMPPDGTDDAGAQA